MQDKKFTNKLIHETSPYLLQHAHNPVKWYPWGEEALSLAQQEDKPILVSIGYSACHWCHVMERESFEDEETAGIMNKYFVNIKIDREERPDLDHIYMDAVQAMTGSGGWPLNVFLTPDAKPFYGGTYFPPVRAYNRMSWKELLQAIADAYKNKKDELELQANNLTQHIIDSNNFGATKTEEIFFSKEDADKIADYILKAADKEWGGFGAAPKFPQTFSIQYLLQYHYYTKNEEALQQALLSLDKMIQGGIYDHVGGGFARYSTDAYWLAPHFEKMLYDNALLIWTLAEAYQVTGKETYKTVIEETVDFIVSEMMNDQYGFYSAFDADSDGVEGKYYTWEKNEIEKLLAEDADLFCRIYDVTEKGNWEHTNILWLKKPLSDYTGELKSDENELIGKMKLCRGKLKIAREKRNKPLLDDKILLGWNALMNVALSKAYAATGNTFYIETARKNMLFLEHVFMDKENNWYHMCKNGESRHNAFLDDLAFIVLAYIQLQEVTGEKEFLIKAKCVSEKLINEFSDEENKFFFYTGIQQEDILVRKKEIYDGATPSGNSVMAYNLFYLGSLFDIKSWSYRAEQMLKSLHKIIINYPTSFGIWCSLLQITVEGLKEVVIVGSDCNFFLNSLNRLFLPGRIVQSTEKSDNFFPLLKGKADEETMFYLCKNYSCLNPVRSLEEFILLTKSAERQ